MASPILNLAGKTAIVTGGSQGIGRAISLAFAKRGAKVVLNYSSNAKAAEEAIDLITKETGREGNAIAVQADVSSEAAVKALFDKANEAFGAIHIVVNSAGMAFGHYPSLVNTTEAEWEKIFNVNTKGAFLVSREAANRVQSGGGGRILNITTTLCATLMPGYAAYAASKAAVETFTKIMAKELKGKRITCNCVAPGPVATELFFQGKTEAMIENIGKTNPLERLGKPEDIANTVLFIVSDEGEWLNAQVIRANGGLAPST